MSSSNEALAWAWRQSIPKKPLAKLLLIAIAGETTRITGGPFTSEPGLNHLSQLTGMHESAVRRNLTVLTGLGLITRHRSIDEKGRRQRDRYELPVSLVASVPTIQSALDQVAENPLGRERTGTRAHTSDTLFEDETGAPTGTRAQTSTSSTEEQEPKNKNTPPTKRRAPFEDTPEFAAFWTAYPRRVSKGAARVKFQAALNRGIPADRLIDGARRYAESVSGKDPQYIAHPDTWLNQERWEDEYPTVRNVGGRLISADGLSYTGTDGVTRPMPPGGRFRAE